MAETLVGLGHTVAFGGMQVSGLETGEHIITLFQILCAYYIVCRKKFHEYIYIHLRRG